MYTHLLNIFLSYARTKRERGKGNSTPTAHCTKIKKNCYRIRLGIVIEWFSPNIYAHTWRRRYDEPYVWGHFYGFEEIQNTFQLLYLPLQLYYVKRECALGFCTGKETNSWLLLLYGMQEEFLISLRRLPFLSLIPSIRITWYRCFEYSIKHHPIQPSLSSTKQFLSVFSRIN